MDTVLLQRGQVWNCLYPFDEDSGAAKRRPVIVLGWTDTGHLQDDRILVVPCTTFNGDSRKALRGDIAVDAPESCGLREGTFIRARRPAALTPKAFDFPAHSPGTVPTSTVSDVLKEIGRMFATPAIATRTY